MALSVIAIVRCAWSCAAVGDCLSYFQETGRECVQRHALGIEFPGVPREGVVWSMPASGECVAWWYQVGMDNYEK